MIVRTAASLLVIAWATGAAAQSQPANPPPGSNPGAAKSSTEVGEVVVTAQRRAQRLEDVPISVAAATPEQIEVAGGASIENLTKVIPGAYFQNATYGLSPTIRGIGSTLPASGGEQNVALYVDNIYYPTPTGNIFDLASVSDIEVLKGPQGTLFGRNATGGAILLHTLDPGFTYTGRLNASYDNLGETRASAYLDVPLGDKVAFNTSFAYRYSNGYIHDLKTGDTTDRGNDYASRSKLLLQATDKLQVILTFAHGWFNDPTGDVFESLKPAPLLLLLGGGPVATDRYHSSQGAPDQFIQTLTDEVSARIKYDTDYGVLTSNTAYLYNTLNGQNDLSGTYIPEYVQVVVDTHTFEQEVNFTSPANKPLTYVVGLYYFYNDATVPTLTENGAPLFNAAGTNYALAGYADGTYRIGNLSLIAGIRYSNELRKGESAQGVSAPSLFTRFQEARDKQATPRVGLEYALGERTNVYATYSQGFKSGSFDLSSPNGPGVIPEKVHAYEVGFKSASRVFSYNLAGYYYDYLDTQVDATTSGNGQIFTELFNVPKSEIYGAEADATERLGDHFDVQESAAYTHARYISFPNAPGYTADPTNPGTLGGLIFANIPVDASGKNMVRAPEFSASATFRYHVQLSETKKLEVTLSPYYSSRVYFTFDNTLSQAPYATLDGNVSLSLNDHLKVSVFGHNITDTSYYKGMSQNALAFEIVQYAPPASYGVALAFSF
jgi:iron complex outermembrane receptor protein